MTTCETFYELPKVFSYKMTACRLTQNDDGDDDDDDDDNVDDDNNSKYEYKCTRLLSWEIT